MNPSPLPARAQPAHPVPAAQRAQAAHPVVPAAVRRAAEYPLVARARAGDMHAFALLIGQHRPRMLHWMTLMLGDRHEAEDAVQLICLAAYRAIGRFRGDCLFSSWLFRIGQRLADHARVQRRRRLSVEVDAALAPEPLAGAEAEPEVLLAGQQTALRLLAGLARLPAPTRQALLLYGVEGSSYAQIAHVQQCPVSTVRSRIHAGRCRLAAGLEQEPFKRP
jgi:RNA polymerase sigma-70 factor (ECF subfamily)